MPESKDINFDVIKEDWNIYKLEDGTILKIKTVLLRVIHEGGLDPSGNPMIGTLINTMVIPIPPKELRHPEKIDKIIDLKYEVIKENWNEYSASDGFIIRIKPVISQIDRSDKLDPRGEPMYGINMQPSTKRIPKKAAQ